MKIDTTKFVVDESRSNPMVVAMQHPDCPIKEICVYLAVGFGSPLHPCKHFKVEGEDSAECLYKTNEEEVVQ